MTEPRLAALFAGFAGFRRGIIDWAGDLAEQARLERQHAEALARSIPGIDAQVHRSAMHGRADEIERIASQLAQGLEALGRLADEAQDDTLVGIEILDDDTPVREPSR